MRVVVDGSKEIATLIFSCEERLATKQVMYVARMRGVIKPKLYHRFTTTCEDAERRDTEIVLQFPFRSLPIAIDIVAVIASLTQKEGGDTRTADAAIRMLDRYRNKKMAH
jgi:hypothetical protein